MRVKVSVRFVAEDGEQVAANGQRERARALLCESVWRSSQKTFVRIVNVSDRRRRGGSVNNRIYVMKWKRC